MWWEVLSQINDDTHASMQVVWGRKKEDDAGSFSHLINARVLAAKSIQLPQLMSLAQYVHPSRSSLPIFLHLQYQEPHEDPVKHCSCATPEMCTCPQIHEVAIGNKVPSLHPMWPYCWGSQEEDLALRLQHLLVDTQHSLQKHMNHRMLKHSLSKMSHRSAQHSSWVQLQPRITPVWVCPHLFVRASTRQCNLHKPSSIQVTQLNFTLGQGKGTREIFPFPRSTKYEPLSTDVDHSSSCLLYRSFDMHMLYHPIHAFL